MKALLLTAIAAVAGLSYVGYSYSSTDGKSCLVCPMTGEPIFTSSESDNHPCGASGSLATLATPGVDCGSCCSKEDTDSTLTSASDTDCTGQCEQGCCKDQADSIAENSGT